MANEHRAAVVKARDQIVAEFRLAATDRDGEGPFWGQYFDDPLQRHQVGVFGTAAAIEVLAASNDPTARALGSRSEFALRDDEEGFVLKAQDRLLTYKVAALVECLGTRNEALEDSETGWTRELEHMRLEGSGWGYHAAVEPTASGFRAPPDVTATSVALLALRRVDPTSGASYDDAVRWLVERVDTRTVVPMYRLALPLLALSAFRGDVEGLSEAKAALAQAVDQRLGDGLAMLHPESEEYRAPYGQLGRYGSRYMFYLPAVVGSLALLSDRGFDRMSVRCRQSVENFVRDISAQVLQDRFRPIGRNWTSTVDYLWIDRLLDRFLSVTP